jgi:hypothetical protein
MKIKITTEIEVDIDKYLFGNDYENTSENIEQAIKYFKNMPKGLILLAHSRKLDDQKWWSENEREVYRKFKLDYKTQIDVMEQMFKNCITE